MLEHTSEQVQVKAAGKSGTLDRVLILQEMGVTRTGTGQTEQLFQDAMGKFA
jgi:deoxyribose-phosphate aldolase